MQRFKAGFTIVELLVVIVVIGILAAITIVSYSGISGKASASVIQGDLSNASKQLKLFETEYGYYPSTIQCDIPDSSTNKCIKVGNGATLNYTVNNSGSKRFYIEATSGNTKYIISNNSTPVVNNWVIIGTQAWLKTNLNVGTRINGTIEQTNNSVVEKYCYNDLESNCDLHGGLYQWDEMMQYSTTEGAQGICPASSHLPTDNEWKTLEKYLGMSDAQADGTGYRGTDQGTKVKVGGSSGLEIKLSGYRDLPGGNFSDMNTHGVFWLSTNPSAYGYRGFTNGNPQIYRVIYSKSYGMSVRCVLD